MSQSLSAVYLHVVFSTKDRRPLLKEPEVRLHTHDYLGGIARDLECPPIQLGGVEDHVHLLCRMGRQATQAELIKELKRASSIWIKSKWPGMAEFAWQGGYAAFSVSVSNLEKVKDYILRQEEHHQKVDFKAELVAMLKKHGVSWDERYIWD